jgi:hypothetical protein
MATKNFTVSKDASVVNTSTGQNLGQGAGDNVAVGYQASTGWKMRGLMEFNLDFTGVTAITSAKLVVQAYQRSGLTQLTWEMGSGMDIFRNTASWSEGNKGADNVWYSTNAVTWSNKPAYTTSGYAHIAAGSSTGQIPNGTPSTTAEYQLDITDIVKSWAPSATVTGGGDQPNYGITLKMTDETSANGGGVEFRTKEDATINGGGPYAGAYIALTYTSISAPTATPKEPTTTGEVAAIWNLSDTELTWDANSKTALPTLAWEYAANGGGNQTSWRLRIYSTSTGESVLFDSGTVTAAGYQTAESLNVPRYNSDATWCPGGDLADNNGLWASGYDGLVNGAQYWWHVQVTSAAGLTSSSETRYPFKVRWGQRPYYFDLGASYTSTAEHQTYLNAASNGSATRLYASSSSNSVSPTTWYTSITAASPASNRYLWVLVRLAQIANATGQPTVSGLDATWNSSASTPDGWVVDSTYGGTLALTPSKRRFGTRAAKFTLAAATGAISAYRNSAGDGVPVVERTTYTFSCYINDNGYTAAGNSIVLSVYPGSSTSGVLSGTALATSDPHTTFLQSDEDPVTGVGWRRMSVTFNSGGNTIIRPAISCSGLATNNIIYVDGALVEEGSVIRSYTPGTVNSPAVVEGLGVQIDAAAGGKLRLRGSTGGSRDVIELGANGLVFGGSTNPSKIYSGAEYQLTLDGHLRSLNAGTGSQAFYASLNTDSVDRFAIYADGKQEWGAGGSTPRDTNLYRSAANTLKTDDSLSVGGDLTVTGTLTPSFVNTLNITTGATIVFEGSANDAFETTLTVANPTADRTITLPDATGTAMLTGGAISFSGDVSGSGTVSSTGAITVTNMTVGSNAVALGTNTTGNYVASLVAGSAITLTNNTGEGATPTVAVTAGGITATEIAAGAVGASELSSSISITTTGTMTPTGTADITSTSGYNSVYMGGSSGVTKRFYRFTGVSEERLKENIEPTSLTPDAIYGLNPIDFNFKASASEEYPDIEFPTTRQWGITVENAREVFPSAISGGHDGQPYGIHWERVYFGMLVAIKDLNKRVLELETKIAELEGRE